MTNRVFIATYRWRWTVRRARTAREDGAHEEWAHNTSDGECNPNGHQGDNDAVTAV
ncbi:MAG TPA: hypothetical protein VJ650_09060 [Gemmatimonadaceae bacterium]|nr:hypothetical protein [Gemmatimonadaceae bacterium]